MVIASETGSGKTIAYVAPIIQQILSRRAAATEAGDGLPRQKLVEAIVLCPNNLIVQQVIDVIHGLKGDDGRPLASAAKLSASQVPGSAPDIAVTTPTALQSFLEVTEARERRGPFAPHGRAAD